MPLDSALFHQLVDFLQSYLPDKQSRQAPIHLVFNDASLINRINWDGSAYDFTVHLVKTLDQWGEINGTTALELLLKTLPGGTDQQAIIQTLIEQIRTATRTWHWEGSPFPGLQAFQEWHEPIFFGREPDI